jgi:CHAD domain-containing protein
MAKAKEIVGLDCGASARDGIRLVLLSRLEEMCSYRAAALDWSDVEGVHDMRVASRRLRSALRDFLPYLRQRKLRHSKNDLKFIADALGSVRDEDVAIVALEKLAAAAPAEVSAGVEQFANERRRKREGARSELVEAIADEELARLAAGFKDALERALKISRRRKGEDNEQSAESLSLRQAGREIISARLRELQELSASLYRPFKAKPLHRMRIAAKRLRYAIELFDSCWSATLTSFAKEIASLQTSLGELHDCDMWIEELSEALRDTEVESEGEEQTQKRSAAIWLLAHFVKERALHFADALARWHEWEATGFQADLIRSLEDDSTLAPGSARGLPMA